MVKTDKGLPNTCSKCGKSVSGHWYAESEDHAIAGIGVCEDCHNGSARRGRKKKASENRDDNAEE